MLSRLCWGENGKSGLSSDQFRLYPNTLNSFDLRLILDPEFSSGSREDDRFLCDSLTADESSTLK